MEHPPRGASHAPSIRCSNCDADVLMHELAHHICNQAPATTIVDEPEQISGSVDSSITQQALAVNRPSRPFVPRIDPFAISRPGANGELTPASSHGSIGQSPVSPGAGRRSPFLHPPRKASAPVMRRPPSPELLSQDCAFPPFPTNKVKGKTNNTNANTNNKNNQRGRANTPDAGRSSRSFERDAKRSASAGAPRSRFRQGTNDSSRPSTANSSRQPSLSSRAGSRQGSVDEIPPLPPLQPSLSHTTTASDPEPRTLEQLNTWPVSSDSTQAKNTTRAESSPFPDFVVQDSERMSPEPRPFPSHSPEVPNVELPPAPSTEDTAREPSYRAKRPPPIDNLPPTMGAELPVPKPEPSPREAPPSTPTSTIARTLTNFFGRKRNQSTSSKRGNPKTPATDGPRFIALSPDPDPLEQVRVDHSARNSMDTEMVSTPPIHGVQEVSQASTDITPPQTQIPEPSQAQILQPQNMDERSRDPLQSEQEFEKTLAAVGPIPRLSTVPEQAEDSKRVSIDSASSYGSEGFSHSRASSLSTNPLNAHSYGSSISTARTTTSSEEFLSPAFAKLRGADVVPDSPTDPYMQLGRLAPVLERGSATPEDEVEITPPVAMSAPPIPESEGGYFDLAQSKRQRRPSTPGSSRGVCRGCSQTILPGQKSMSSKDGRLTGRYHKECFVCKTCREPFATADFYVHQDLPYCAHDYHVINETLCESCGKGIEGHYLETSNLSGNGAKKFHPHCLKCATCKIQLDEDYFELGGRVYCEKDAFRLMNGPRSPYGTAPSRPSPLNREYISSGEPGQVLAAGKFPERRLTKLMMT